MCVAFIEIRLSATDGNRCVVSGVCADEESEAPPDTFRISTMSLEFCFNLCMSWNVCGEWRWSSILTAAPDNVSA
jgi:hypothetical protein